MGIDVLLGLQWGDEGKGKIVDYLAPKYNIVARFQGGPNAGHTLKFDGKKFVLHTIPSGIFREELTNLIGNGVVLDPITLEKEIQKLEEVGVNFKDRLFIARKAHLILPTHRYLDAASENAKGKAKIGSTLRGIGPTYMDKTGRNGLRVGDVVSPNFLEKYETLKQKHLTLLGQYPAVEFDLEGEEQKWMDSLQLLRSLNLVDCEYFMNKALSEGKRILAEGAQGSMLDIDFGTYPFVTSSNTITAGVCTGLGVAPQTIKEVIGITKAYCTRVGSGPFPTELHDETGELLRKEGAEFGATTGRPRRCGWIDLPQLKYTIILNGVTQLNVTKLDVLNIFDTIYAATHYKIDGQVTDELPFDLCDVEVEPVYEAFGGWNQALEAGSDYDDLPQAARTYLEALERYLGLPITIISVGPERASLILKD
ncbi:adenylosuccinate synthase [Haliscomenobacter hydrossis]|uniref:Adenylosuccinate synthetase n=2 Tax=Haliscomenobacter TaxID=2349 RepID=F4L315_HALH1|nr:adenylosuccinate synthase [Haliscomenobacter hydrossis]AEE50674.1 Adenylosuccinate synthetase [Haliscomenobacter hydrossis DSM 1100]